MGEQVAWRKGIRRLQSKQCAGAENWQWNIGNKVSATQNRELLFTTLPAGKNWEAYYGKIIKVEKQRHTESEKIVPEQNRTKKV